MLKKNVVIGGYYAIAHTSYDRLSVVELLSPNKYGGYNARKLSTGNMIRVKSAAKLRYQVKINGDYVAGKSHQKWVAA
jgi:hypothetical protein